MEYEDEQQPTPHQPPQEKTQQPDQTLIQILDIELSLEELETKYKDALETKKHVRIYKGKTEKTDVYIGYCEDCSTFNKLNWINACADEYDCCLKLVCNDECTAYCSAGHANYYYNCGDEEFIECDTCKERIEPNCTWWGISIAEYERRYG